MGSGPNKGWDLDLIRDVLSCQRNSLPGGRMERAVNVTLTGCDK